MNARISKTLRRAVLDSFGPVRGFIGCTYCTALLPVRLATLDHVIPRALGGETSLHNLVPACGRCNVRKADRLPTPQELERITARRRIARDMQQRVLDGQCASCED